MLCTRSKKSIDMINSLNLARSARFLSCWENFFSGWREKKFVGSEKREMIIFLCTCERRVRYRASCTVELRASVSSPASSFLNRQASDYKHPRIFVWKKWAKKIAETESTSFNLQVADLIEETMRTSIILHFN